MKRVLILVEGETEEQFVNDVLYAHLAPRGVYVRPTSLDGVAKWSQIAGDLHDLLRDTAAVGITTMIDYYGLPHSVPGMSDRPAAAARQRVEHVERAIAAHVTDARFRPHLMLHEFEALLFADLGKWRHHFSHAGAVAELARDVAGLPPEAINETYDGKPSRRIRRRLGEEYRKPIHGPLAAADIGLAAIREACPHFGEWLAWLESL